MPYAATDDGRLRPGKPDRCPSAATATGDCQIHIERWRKRKCGPKFFLYGMICLTHEKRFTIYPPGWTPYGRKPLAPLDHLGRPLNEPLAKQCWQETLFDAVLDAERAERWPEEVTLGPSATTTPQVHCMKTQCRQIAGAMRLFALDQRAEGKEREVVSRELQLDLAVLHEESGRIRDGPNMTTRGKAGARILAKLPVINHTVSGLLALGKSQSFWGPSLPGQTARSVHSSAKTGSGIKGSSCEGGQKDATKPQSQTS